MISLELVYDSINNTITVPVYTYTEWGFSKGTTYALERTKNAEYVEGLVEDYFNMDMAGEYNGNFIVLKFH